MRLEMPAAEEGPAQSGADGVLAEGPLKDMQSAWGSSTSPAWESATWCQLCSLKWSWLCHHLFPCGPLRRSPDVGNYLYPLLELWLRPPLIFPNWSWIVVVSACFPLTNPSMDHLNPWDLKTDERNVSLLLAVNPPDISLCQTPGKLIFINKYEFVILVPVYYFFNLCIIELEW